MKPPFPTREDFIVAWNALTLAERDSPAYKTNFWSHMHWMDLIADHPEEAFGVILEILSREQSRLVMQSLSAGPLEDLLTQHGDRFIYRMEEEAEKNSSFRKLLGGVWKNAMTDPVWMKVQQIRDRRGWDGIPENAEQK